MKDNKYVNNCLIDFEAKNPKNDREITYILTKESVLNESGRLFKVADMDLSYIKEMKSVYYNHNTDDLPIGKINRIWKTGDEIRATVEFADMETSSIADTIFRLIKGKYINGGSIGVTANSKDIEFPEKPMKVGGKQVAMIIHKSELKEFSITPRPDNRAAVPLNASIDAAMKDGVIDETEANEFKLFYSKIEATSENETDVTSNPEQTNTNSIDEVVALKAKIAELELQLKEQAMDEELEGSVYDELYAEFIGDNNTNDEKDSFDELYNEFFKED